MIAAVVALFGLLPGGAALAAGPVVLERMVTCAECGMSAKVANRFTSRIVQGTATLYFCDIGDMAVFLRRTNPKEKEYAAAVRDFKSGAWVEAEKAFYVTDKKIFSTPMGWGVAAFRDRAEASGPPLDIDAVRKALR